MRRFILRQNIQHFELMLERASGDAERRRLQTLLAETRDELALHEHIWSWTCPHLAVPGGVGSAAENLLDRIVQGSSADFGSLQLWDEDAQCLRLMAHTNFDGDSARRFATVGTGAGSVCEAAHVTGSACVIEDMDQADGFPSLRDWTLAMGIRAIHSTPILDAKGRFVGVFSTHFRKPRALTLVGAEAGQQNAQRIAALISSLSRR